ncbi:MAG: TetR/AcrR family transcriptional regulator [Owenweeksia sp.]|nr:TetR/AcrR family transcriptional regulator [Owenweeksia sp.]
METWETFNTKNVSHAQIVFTLAPAIMENQEQEIVAAAFAMFNKYGVRSVTMDDVARELSISKKTLYKYFENKADLVHKCIRSVYDQVEDALLAVHEQADNAIDELFEIDEVVGRIMENHNPGMRYQLQKYYPQTYNYMYEGRHDLIHKMISENLERGKRDGWFRQDVETDIITFLYCSKVETMPEEDEEMMARHPIKRIAGQSLEYHIRGVATKKGLAYLEEKLMTYPKK